MMVMMILFSTWDTLKIDNKPFINYANFTLYTFYYYFHLLNCKVLQKSFEITMNIFIKVSKKHNPTGDTVSLHLFSLLGLGGLDCGNDRIDLFLHFFERLPKHGIDVSSPSLSLSLSISSSSSLLT